MLAVILWSDKQHCVPNYGHTCKHCYACILNQIMAHMSRDTDTAESRGHNWCFLPARHLLDTLCKTMIPYHTGFLLLLLCFVLLLSITICCIIYNAYILYIKMVIESNPLPLIDSLPIPSKIGRTWQQLLSCSSGKIHRQVFFLYLKSIRSSWPSFNTACACLVFTHSKIQVMQQFFSSWIFYAFELQIMC